MGGQDSRRASQQQMRCYVVSGSITDINDCLQSSGSYFADRIRQVVHLGQREAHSWGHGSEDLVA